MLNKIFKLSETQIVRLKNNLKAHALGISLSTIIQLIYPPLMIWVWGIDKFGIWIFLSSIPFTLSFLNFNFTEYAKQEMTIYNTKNEIEKVQEIFQTSIVLVLLGLFFFVLITSISLIFFDFDFSLTKSLSGSKIKLIVLLIVISIMIDVIMGIFICGIYVFGKNYISNYISILSDALLKISLVLAGIFVDDIFYLALLLVLFSFFKLILIYVFFKKINLYLVLSLKFFSFKNLLVQIKKSSSYIYEHASAIIRHNGQIVLIGIFFNPQIVAYVSTCKTLFFFFPSRILGELNNISSFEYAELFAKKSLKKLQYNHYKHVQLFLLISAIIILGGILFGPYVYELWMSNKFELGIFLTFLIVLFSCSETLKQAIISPKRSMNDFFKFSFSEFVMVIIAQIITCLLLYLNFSFISSFVILLIFNFIMIIIAIFSMKTFYFKNY